MSFELIEAEKGNYPKALMCRALGLSRSGHHAFRTRGPSRRDLEQQQLDVLVAAIFAELSGRYGSPRIEKELRKRGFRTSRKRVAASMVRQGLVARLHKNFRVYNQRTKTSFDLVIHIGTAYFDPAEPLTLETLLDGAYAEVRASRAA